jgi:hypothetical protein
MEVEKEKGLTELLLTPGSNMLKVGREETKEKTKEGEEGL